MAWSKPKPKGDSTVEREFYGHVRIGHNLSNQEAQQLRELEGLIESHKLAVENHDMQTTEGMSSAKELERQIETQASFLGDVGYMLWVNFSGAIRRLGGSEEHPILPGLEGSSSGGRERQRGMSQEEKQQQNERQRVKEYNDQMEKYGRRS